MTPNPRVMSVAPYQIHTHLGSARNWTQGIRVWRLTRPTSNWASRKAEHKDVGFVTFSDP